MGEFARLTRELDETKGLLGLAAATVQLQAAEIERLQRAARRNRRRWLRRAS